MNLHYTFLSNSNVDKYIVYLQKAFSQEPEMMCAENIDSSAIMSRLDDPFYQNSKSILAVDDDAVIGRIEYHFYGCLQDGYRMAYVDWVYVLPEYRHQGVAQRLFKEFEAECRKNRIDQYYLIRSTDDDADSFYRAFQNASFSEEPFLRKILNSN